MSGKVRCGNCGRAYSRYSAANAIWCRKDTMLFCSRCVRGAKGRCPLCASRTSALAPMLVVMGLMFSLMGGFFMALMVPDSLHEMSVNQMEVTSLESLPTGGTIKVSADISPGQGVVLSGYDVKDSNGNWVMKWTQFKDFNLTDNSTTLLVNVSELTQFMGSPRAPPGHDSGYDYQSGDHVGVLGNLVRHGNVTVLYATMITDHPPTFYLDPTFGLYFSISFGAIALAALLAGVALVQAHVRLHEATLARSGRQVRWEKVIPPPVQDSIEWHENAYVSRMRSIYLSTGVASIALVPLLLGSLYWSIMGGPSWTSWAFAWALVAEIFTSIIAVGYRSYFGRRIGRIGISAQGLYLDYPHKRPPNARTYYPWDEISELSTGPMPNSKMITLKTSFGEEWLVNLDPDTLRLLREGFTRNRAAAVPPPRSGEPLTPTLPSLLGEHPSTTATEIVWRPNPLRASRVRWSLILFVLQVPSLLPVFIWPNFGIWIDAGAISYLFFPSMLGAMQLWFAYSAMSSEEGLSAVGLHLKMRAGTKVIPWSDVSELSVVRSVVKVKTNAGIADSLTGLDPEYQAEVVRKLEDFYRRKRGDPPDAFPKTVIFDWMVNPRRVGATLLFYLSLGLPSAGVVATVVGSYYLTGSWLLAGAFGVLPGMGYLWMLRTSTPYRTAPARVGFSSTGFAAEYPGETPLSAVQAFCWKDVYRVNTEGGLAILMNGGWVTRNDTTRYLNFLSEFHVNRLLGPVSKEIEERILSQFPSTTRQDWKS